MKINTTTLESSLSSLLFVSTQSIRNANNNLQTRLQKLSKVDLTTFEGQLDQYYLQTEVQLILNGLYLSINSYEALINCIDISTTPCQYDLTDELKPIKALITKIEKGEY